MKRKHGFALLEAIITFAILIILATIAIFSYQYYVRRNYYDELVQATVPYQVAVNDCAQNHGSLSGCDAGTNSIPNAVTNGQGPVASITVSGGVITANPVASHGILPTDSYILTPTMASNGVVTWTTSGDGVTKGYVKH